MKNPIYTIFLILLSFCSCYAQRKVTFNQPIVKGAKQIYQVKKSLFNTKFIQNINGRFYNVENPVQYNARAPEPEDKIVDVMKMAAICHEIFNDERLRQLTEDTDHIQIVFKTDLQGNILDMIFSFKETSSLTAQEVETMESRFKKELNVKINPKRFVGYIYIPVSKLVVFDRLLKNMPNAVQ
jgi:hypothetical protein